MATLFSATIGTVRRWSDAGMLASERTPGGHRRYRAADVEQTLRTQFAEAEGEAHHLLADRLARRTER